MNRTVGVLRGICVGVAFVLVMAACGSDVTSPSSGATGTSGTSAGAPQGSVGSVAASPVATEAPQASGGSVAASTVATEAPKASGGSHDAATVAAEALAGRFGALPDKPNPAPTHKVVWIISSGEATPTAHAVSNGIKAAMDAVGWTYQLCDSELDPAKMVNCWEQAVAAGPDGIFGIATECPTIKGPLEAAKKKGIATIPAFAWDCAEVNQGQALYSASFSDRVSDRYHSAADYFRASGRDAAAFVIAKSKKNPEVLSFLNKEYYVLTFWDEGFVAGIKEFCPDCKVIEKEFVVSEFGPDLESRTSALLVQNPQIAGIQGTYNPQLGITGAVANSGRRAEIKLVGGLGLSNDADSIRAGQLDATVAHPLRWYGFDAVDSMISVFNKTPQRDTGLGWQIMTADQNLPPVGSHFQGSIDFETAFLKSWGIKK